MLEGGLPPEINHLRLGESLLLGRETAHGMLLEGARADCFALVAQVIELKRKTPREYGATGHNALGQQVKIALTGPAQLAVLNIGAVDCEVGGLVPLTPGIRIIGFSSDHLIIDVGEAPPISVGDEIRLRPDYHALATAMTSPYLAQTASGTPRNRKERKHVCHCHRPRH